MKALIWLEGIIGSGKTTAAREIGRRLELRVLEEPVAENYLLEPFYADQRRWAYPLQMLLLHRRYAMQQIASYECTPAGNHRGAILDRSISGDRVFARLHVDAGNIDPLEMRVYEEAYETMARSLLPPTLLVYLDVQATTAHRRMASRGRPCEAGVPLAYLEALRAGYAQLIRDAERGLTPWAHAVRVLRLGWDRDTITPAEWDATAKTIEEACER